MKTIVSLRNYLLMAAVVAVLTAIPVSSRLEFDQRIESFFADDNPDLEVLKRSRKDFGGNEFVIVAWTEKRLFATDPERPYPASLEAVLEVDFLPEIDDTAADRIRAVTQSLHEIPGVNVQETQHLVSLLGAAPRYKPSRRSMLRLFEGTLVGRDGRTTGILLELLPEQDARVSRAETIRRIREVAAQMRVDVSVAGEPVQVLDMFQMVEQDGQLLFLVSLGVLSLVLLLMFRSLRWVLAPVGLVLGAVLITRAVLVLVGAELSMVSSMLNSIVTVIGIATCMHVIVHYRDLRIQHQQQHASDQLSAHASHREVARQTIQDMAAPIFWTCVTTAVGFASLLVSQITPVRSFAVMMCLATAVVLVACVMILPATLASGSRLKNPALVPLEHRLDQVLALTCRTVERHPVVTAVVCGALFLIAIPGLLRLQIETDFSKNFKPSSSIVQSLQFVESRLGGAGSWEVSFDTPPELDDEFLEKIMQLTEQLRELTRNDDTIRVLSLTDVADLPPRIFGPARALARIRNKQPELIENFYNAQTQRMRIVLRSAEQQPSENKATQIAMVRRCVNDFFEQHQQLPQDTPPAASGMFVLLAELILSLLSDQLLSFLVACGGILVCMTVAFRSLRIGIVSLFPNIFPVAIVMGLLGWLGTPVNIGTAMITSVSMGLTVDSTIHYITAFERLRKTHSITQALQLAHAGAGRAVAFAHLALVAGFLVLTASRFVPLVYFGALLSLSLIGGVFGDLVLLPLLLRWTTPKSQTAV